jgi:dTMP kinase
VDQEKRGGFGEEKYEKREMQDRVRELFNDIMKKPENEDFVRIDAGRPLEAVQKSIRAEVLKAMEIVDREEGPLRVVKPW